jgi:CHAT domain-containing protein
LQLLAERRSSLRPEKISALLGGISEATQGFSPLPAVDLELAAIAAQIPTETLRNQAFTRDALTEKMVKTSFPVIHLATHGQFSSNSEETFILTWDDKIKVKDLQSILRDRRRQTNPLELLVLSACQTAEGDNRATLGLAGMAVRSGARSTLATLWSVNDQSTAAFMAEFYRQLTQPNITKAEAQRLGQIKLLTDPKYRHPFYWAPFVLVGNWQ